MEKLFKMMAALIALATLPVDKREDGKLKNLLRELQMEIEVAKDFGNDDKVKVLEETAAQLRKELDEQSEEMRKLQKRSLIGPTVTNGFYRPGVRRFKFSSRDLAKDFAQFCLDIRSGSKDLTPVDDSEGGYLIPDAQISDEISIMVESVGLASQLGRPVPMGPGGFSQNRRLGGATAYWKAAGAAGTKSTPSFGKLDMKAETLICLVDIDMELDEDSMVDLGNYLASEFAYAIAYKEDSAAFVGDGSAEYGGITGILNSDRVTTVDMGSGDTAFSNISYDDTIDLEAAVWEGALVSAQYLMHRTIKANVKKLKDTANNPIWQRTSGPEPDDLNGYPLRTAGLMRANSASAVSTTFVVFGDFHSGLYYGRRGRLRIDYSDHAGFENAQRVWRALNRIDIAVNGFTSSEISAHSELANPLVVLKTAAS